MIYMTKLHNAIYSMKENKHYKFQAVYLYNKFCDHQIKRNKIINSHGHGVKIIGNNGVYYTLLIDNAGFYIDVMDVNYELLCRVDNEEISDW